MATALCTSCGGEVRWYAGRGRRLADVRTRCCGARAAAKQTLKGHRGDPSLRLEARLGDYEHRPGAGSAPSSIKQLWRTETVRVALLADGRVQFGKAWRRYAPTETVERGWRHFKCTRTDTHNYYCAYEDRAWLRDEDYRRLLAKGAGARPSRRRPGQPSRSPGGTAIL